MNDVNDYLRGIKDCQNGVEHKKGQSSDYYRGYSAQYTKEQNLSDLVK